jgi:hypothetical protein
MSEAAVETQRRETRDGRRAWALRKLGALWLKALHAEWKKLSAGLASELPERELRIQWTNQRLHKRRLNQLKPDITSWSELTEGEARYLLKLMKEESGSAPDYRGMLICKLAQELFGQPWFAALTERLSTRFRKRAPADLAPAEAHAEIEELMSRIARRDGIEIEAVRARFSPQRAQRAQR